MSKFKDLVQEDITNVFMNEDEFAEIHSIDGQAMPVLVDGNEAIERSKKAKSDVNGLYAQQLLIYVKAEYFKGLPVVGRALRFDEKIYTIVDAVNEDGLFTITLEGNTSHGKSPIRG